jgi:hypothetical protein
MATEEIFNVQTGAPEDTGGVINIRIVKNREGVKGEVTVITDMAHATVIVVDERAYFNPILETLEI